MACYTDWDFGCGHCDSSRKNFGASIKEYIGKSPCWGHTGYFIFELKDKNTGKRGIFRFKNIYLDYRPTEICHCVNGCDPLIKDCEPCNGLPSSWPEGCPYSAENPPPNDPYEIWEETEIPIEVSVDGIYWIKIYGLPFQSFKGPRETSISFSDYIRARFIRFRMPIDVGHKSLAGYLDHIRFNIDCELVEEENNIVYDDRNEISLPPSECLENIDGSANYSSPVYSNSECPPYGKYCFASCIHSATWFAGFNKMWKIEKVTGTFETVPFRGEENGYRCPTTTSVNSRSNRETAILLQYSVDGVNWNTVGEIVTDRGATTEFSAEFDTPVDARYIRLAPKPVAWGNGSNLQCWLKNAELTITTEMPEGRVAIIDSFIPTDAYVNESIQGYVNGEVQDGSVVNPAVGIAYIDGPAPSIQIGGKNVSKMEAVISTKAGERPEGTTLSFSGDIVFPVAGTYTLYAVAGRIAGNDIYPDEHVEYVITVIPPPECEEGETKCVGYDLYQCINGKWQFIKSNAEECGYVPPECEEGEQKCIGYDLYQCINGKWVKIKQNAEECGYVPPECNEGEQKCVGYNLYQCINGRWQLVEVNSEQCGYVPPEKPSWQQYILPLALIGGVLLGAVIARQPKY